MEFVLYWILNGVIGTMSFIMFELWNNNINCVPKHAWPKINGIGMGIAMFLGPFAAISSVASIAMYLIKNYLR